MHQEVVTFVTITRIEDLVSISGLLIFIWFLVDIVFCVKEKKWRRFMLSSAGVMVGVGMFFVAELVGFMLANQIL